MSDPAKKPPAAGPPRTLADAYPGLPVVFVVNPDGEMVDPTTGAVLAPPLEPGGLTSAGPARMVGGPAMSPAAAPSQPPLDLNELRALYEGVDAPTVAEHLVAHPELVPVLVDAAPRLRAAYGEGARLRLEPAFFEGEEMFARVYGHGLTADEAEARGAGFDAWWLAVDPRLDAARRWLEFGVGWGA